MKSVFAFVVVVLLAGCATSEPEHPRERAPPERYMTLFHVEKLAGAGCGYYVYREESNEKNDNRRGYDGSGKPLFVFHDDSAKLLERAWEEGFAVRVWYDARWYDAPCTDFFGKWGLVVWAEPFNNTMRESNASP